MNELEAIQNLNHLADLVYFSKNHTNTIWELDILKEESIDIDKIYYTQAETKEKAEQKFEHIIKLYKKSDCVIYQVKNVFIPKIPIVI